MKSYALIPYQRSIIKRLFDMYPKIMETEKAKESVMDEKNGSKIY